MSFRPLVFTVAIAAAQVASCAPENGVRPSAGAATLEATENRQVADDRQTEGLPESLLSLPPEKAGKILVEHFRSGTPAERAEYKGKLRIRRGNNETVIPLTFRIEPGKNQWQVVYETGAAEGIQPERLVVIHKPDQPNEYLYSRPGKEPVSLKASEAFVPLATSDFALVDLGLDFFHWPAQRVLRGQMRKNRYTYVLDSRLDKSPAAGYGKVVSWIDKETGGPLVAEAYDTKDKLLKEFLVRRFTKVDGKWQLREMEIRNVQTDSLTRIEFEFDGKESETK